MVSLVYLHICQRLLSRQLFIIKISCIRLLTSTTPLPSTMSSWFTSASTVCWLVGCLTSHQHASVSQGRICSDNFTSYHTAIEVADQPFHLTQSQITDIGPATPSTDPITPGAWQGSLWSANFEVTGMTRCHAHMFTHMRHPFMLGCSTQVGRLYNPKQIFIYIFTQKRRKKNLTTIIQYTQFNSHTTGCNASRRTRQTSYDVHPSVRTRPTTYTQTSEHVPRRRLTVSPHDWL